MINTYIYKLLLQLKECDIESEKISVKVLFLQITILDKLLNPSKYQFTHLKMEIIRIAQDCTYTHSFNKYLLNFQVQEHCVNC